MVTAEIRTRISCATTCLTDCMSTEMHFVVQRMDLERCRSPTWNPTVALQLGTRWARRGISHGAAKGPGATYSGVPCQETGDARVFDLPAWNVIASRDPACALSLCFVNLNPEPTVGTSTFHQQTGPAAGPVLALQFPARLPRALI